MKSTLNRLEAPQKFVSTASCKDIPLSVLLGQAEYSNSIPKGWQQSSAIALSPLTPCYVFVVRSGQWMKADYREYSERGQYAEVKVGDRIIKVFTHEHLAVRAIA